VNKIIGINANHADSSSCILINGSLEFAIEEERINRIKHWAGFPKNSIEMCLAKTNIKSDEINQIKTRKLSLLERLKGKINLD
jgi:carbamoyltransferase